MEDTLYVFHGIESHPAKDCDKCADCIKCKEKFVAAIFDGSFNRLTGIELTEEQIKNLIN